MQVKMRTSPGLVDGQFLERNETYTVADIVGQDLVANRHAWEVTEDGQPIDPTDTRPPVAPVNNPDTGTGEGPTQPLSPSAISKLSKSDLVEYAAGRGIEIDTSATNAIIAAAIIAADDNGGDD
jgi:hypothetical protein